MRVTKVCRQQGSISQREQYKQKSHGFTYFHSLGIRVNLNYIVTTCENEGWNAISKSFQAIEEQTQNCFYLESGFGKGKVRAGPFKSFRAL